MEKQVKVAVAICIGIIIEMFCYAFLPIESLAGKTAVFIYVALAMFISINVEKTIKRFKELTWENDNQHGKAFASSIGLIIGVACYCYCVTESLTWRIMFSFILAVLTTISIIPCPSNGIRGES